jgi:hypothetical protein
LEVVELQKMGLLCFPEFNQYVVGFENPFYPQNYPQKFQVSIHILDRKRDYYKRVGLGEGAFKVC